VIGGVGKRFAQYVVIDGEFSTAPFLHTAGDLGLRMVARLKENLRELFTAAQKRFSSSPPTIVFQQGQDRVEIWDAADFDPWNTLRWETVRVFRYQKLPEWLSPDAGKRFNDAWEKMQEDLLTLSSQSKQTIAKNSSHYIQLDSPDLVIDEVRKMVEKVRR
jgi:hypothetical protein